MKRHRFTLEPQPEWELQPKQGHNVLLHSLQTVSTADSLSGYDRRFPPATRLPPTVKAPSMKMSRLKILWDLSQLNVGHLQSGNMQRRGMTTLRLRPIKHPGNRGQKL
jgi:hypothetical protein